MGEALDDPVVVCIAGVYQAGNVVHVEQRRGLGEETVDNDAEPWQVFELALEILLENGCALDKVASADVLRGAGMVSGGLGGGEEEEGEGK